MDQLSTKYFSLACGIISGNLLVSYEIKNFEDKTNLHGQLGKPSCVQMESGANAHDVFYASDGVQDWLLLFQCPKRTLHEDGPTELEDLCTVKEKTNNYQFQITQQ